MLSDILETWQTCERCRLSKTRTKPVLGRGASDPYVVFLGEAPGRNEDHTGMPWIGPSGRFLEYALSDALGSPFDLIVDSAYFLNVLACRPCDSVKGPNRSPSSEEIAACLPRVVEQLEFLKPKVIVRLGLSSQLSTQWLRTDPAWKHVRLVDLAHPAALLRRGGAQAHDYKHYVAALKGIWR